MVVHCIYWPLMLAAGLPPPVIFVPLVAAVSVPPVAAVFIPPVVVPMVPPPVVVVAAVIPIAVVKVIEEDARDILPVEIPPFKYPRPLPHRDPAAVAP